jgi:hypothetical protein
VVHFFATAAPPHPRYAMRVLSIITLCSGFLCKLRPFPLFSCPFPLPFSLSPMFVRAPACVPRLRARLRAPLVCPLTWPQIVRGCGGRQPTFHPLRPCQSPRHGTATATAFRAHAHTCAKLVMPKASLFVTVWSGVPLSMTCPVLSHLPVCSHVCSVDCVARMRPALCGRHASRIVWPALCGPHSRLHARLRWRSRLRLRLSGLLARAWARAVSVPTSHTRPSARVPSPSARQPSALPACLS